MRDCGIAVIVNFEFDVHAGLHQEGKKPCLIVLLEIGKLLVKAVEELLKWNRRHAALLSSPTLLKILHSHNTVSLHLEVVRGYRLPLLALVQLHLPLIEVGERMFHFVDQ